ncbi:MAG: hypothetical protein ACOX9R_11575 [Armatimonadota bacterium]|jgi:tRNA nucleotidyltransferase (CCA-adding enzyme)
MPAYLVGGPVRALLLGRSALDLDVAIDGPVAALGEALCERLAATVCKTTEFMTSTLLLEDGVELDLARTRTETYPEPGALPVVTPATLEDDLDRRDFTVNAMAMSLEPRRFGELIDPHGGREDVISRRLRVLHETSFEDDPTRMLRAARFMLRLGFRLEPKTAELLRRAVAERRAATVSGARLRNELEYLFREAPARGLAMLQELGLLEAMGLEPASGEACATAVLVPEAAEGLGIGLSEIEPMSACLAVYVGLSEQGAAGLAVRLMLEACARDAILQGSALIARPPGVLSRPARNSELFFALRGLRPEAAVALWTVLRDDERARLGHYWGALRGACVEIAGTDLIAAGRRPGPRFSEALQAALEAKLDEGADREKQLAIALSVLDRTSE